MPDHEVEALRKRLAGGGPTADGYAGVWPHNRAAVDAFLAGSSQWRVVATMTEKGTRVLWIGLDYAGMKVALDAFGIELAASTMAGVRTMESAARAALNGDAP